MQASESFVERKKFAAVKNEAVAGTRETFILNTFHLLFTSGNKLFLNSMVFVRFQWHSSASLLDSFDYFVPAGHSLRSTLCSWSMSVQSTIPIPLDPELSFTLRMQPLKFSRIMIVRLGADSVEN